MYTAQTEPGHIACRKQASKWELHTGTTLHAYTLLRRCCFASHAKLTLQLVHASLQVEHLLLQLLQPFSLACEDPCCCCC